MHEPEDISRLSAKRFGSRWAPSALVADYGVGLTRMSDAAEFDFRHDATGLRIELKAARAKHRAFIFQYIRPECFDLCVCLGWKDGAHRYWIFDSKQIQQHLTRQHRHMGTFQLRLVPDAPPSGRAVVQPSRLRAELDRRAKTATRSRRLVRLDAALGHDPLWSAVARAIQRRLRECGLTDWQFVLRPLQEEMDDPDLLPYPDVFPKERRIELQVHPEPFFGSNDVAATAGSIFDFLLEYLDGDDDLEDEGPV